MRDMGLAKRIMPTPPAFDLESYLRARAAAVDRALDG
jgi:hypothetical protein